jgi:hypothetical protein
MLRQTLLLRRLAGAFDAFECDEDAGLLSC